ncbi:MAG: 2Fe-2S iron-sulfur cluster binding domain-containing protein [Methylocystaceae bacterium]|nr:2Fe-2S iron-sulfur cluster binding domain-containing protein [Methylocystaceae bacterium]
MKKYIITVLGQDRTYPCYEGQRLLHAIEGAGGDCIRVGCREGGCGVCRVKIHSGEYETGIMSKAHIGEEEKKQGLVLSCRVYPKGDLTVEPAPKYKNRQE